jgi:hypothetical protein
VSPQRPPTADARRCDPVYYQALHDTSSDYQSNNWLLDELPVLAGIGGRSLIEIGCGNGLFLARAVEHWPEVTGLDWARSPVLDQLLNADPRVCFVQQDIAEFRPPRRYDLLVSADFLEHMAPAALPELLTRLHTCADVGYHKIACYDDGHSHLAIFDAETWLRLFREAAPGACYRIVKRTDREARRKKTVIVVSNMPTGHSATNLVAMHAVQPLRLDVGCGARVREGHVGVDVRPLPGVGIVCNAWEIDERVPHKTVHSIYCRHFFEHLTFAQGVRTLLAFHRVLRPQGSLHIIVPDIRYHMGQFLRATPRSPSAANPRWTGRQHALAGFWGWQHEGIASCGTCTSRATTTQA